VGRKGSRRAFLYAFDLLELNGRDLRRESWEVAADPMAYRSFRMIPTGRRYRIIEVSD
jgi:hypothetical protein